MPPMQEPSGNLTSHNIQIQFVEEKPVNFEDQEENLVLSQGYYGHCRSRIPQARRQRQLSNEKKQSRKIERRVKFFLIQQEVSCTIS